MKKFIFMLVWLSLTSTIFAAGGITHMFMAHEAIDQIPDKTLRNILKDNLDAYLVGAYYPDSGYQKGAHYGEESHSDPFIYAFADYLKEKYKNPALENPKLVAFLFGCASHRVDDAIFHNVLYKIMADKDFNGDRDKAHTYGDDGIDLLIMVDKAQWFSAPKTWWIPINDLVAVYKRMGHPDYTADQIIKGNSIIFFAGYGERIIALPSYPYLRWKMPWGARNYYDYPNAGITYNVNQVALYQANLWKRLMGKTFNPDTAAAKKMPQDTKVQASTSSAISETILNQHWAEVPQKENPDGSVELQSPIIKNLAKVKLALKEFFAKF